MAITYNLQPLPHWVIIDNFSKLPAGAAIYTYSSQNPTQFKPAFQDAAGTVPYGQPITGFGNGTMPAIYWAFDSTTPDDLYYIRVYDSANEETQNFLWDVDDFGGVGTGGGGTINNFTNIRNLIVNNVFYRNIGNQSSPLPEFLTLSPSNNAGFVGALDDVGGPASPDIIFAKSNTTATDTLSFPAFSPFGTNVLGTTPTPDIYLNYTCTVQGTETYKYIQFPLVKGVANLHDTLISIKIFAQKVSGDVNPDVYLRQFFGRGGSPSAEVSTLIGTLAFTDANWDSFIFNATVPSINGKTIGSCGNDGLFLQIRFPQDPINFNMTKPAVYVAANPAEIDFQNYDQIDQVINLPRTGDIRTSLNSFVPYGWAAMNDGVISNSGAFVTPGGYTVSRRNIDTFPLFYLLWQTFYSSPTTQLLAPMFDSGGSSVAYGTDAFTDWNNNRQMALTKLAGRALAGVSGSHTIGTYTGTETQTLTSPNQLPAHHHTVSSGGGAFLTTAGTGFNILGAGATSIYFNSQTDDTGASAPFNIMQPTSFMNVFIKL